MHARLIRWRVIKLVKSIEITSAELEAGQQLFIAWEAEQSTQHEAIISATFHGNLCHQNLLSPMVKERIHSFTQPSKSFSGLWRGQWGEGRSKAEEHQRRPPVHLTQTVIYVQKNRRFRISNQPDFRVRGNQSTPSSPAAAQGGDANRYKRPTEASDVFL